MTKNHDFCSPSIPSGLCLECERERLTEELRQSNAKNDVLTKKGQQLCGFSGELLLLIHEVISSAEKHQGRIGPQLLDKLAAAVKPTEENRNDAKGCICGPEGKCDYHAVSGPDLKRVASSPKEHVLGYCWCSDHHDKLDF